MVSPLEEQGNKRLKRERIKRLYEARKAANPKIIMHDTFDEAISSAGRYDRPARENR